MDHSRPPRPGEDVVIEVRHEALVLLPARPDGLPLPRRVPLTTQATIRGVDRDWFTGRREIPAFGGSGRAAPCRPRRLREGGGRLWRRVRVAERRPADAPDLTAALAALSVPGDRSGDTRHDLKALRLGPYEHYHPGGTDTPMLRTPAGHELPEGGAEALAAAAAGLAARMARDLVHDGHGLWLSAPPPLLVADGGIRTWNDDDPDWHRATCPATTAAGAEGYARFLEAAYPSSRAEHTSLGRRAAVVAAACAGIQADPSADLRHFVEQHAIRLDQGVWQFLRGPHAARLRRNPEAMAVLARLRRLSAAASVGVAGGEGIESDLATIEAAAGCLADRMPYAHTMEIIAETVLDYVRIVAMPRLAERPVPDEDAETLGGLTP